MRRRFALICLFIGLSFATAGCRAPGSPLTSNPFGKETQQTQAEPATSRFMAAFRKLRQQEDASSAEKQGSQIAESSQNAHQFDPETEALIERKLAGAPPEQREKMRRDLQGVPPQLIPQVLNAFHLGQQLDNQAEGIGGSAAGAPASPYENRQTITTLPRPQRTPQHMAQIGGHSSPGGHSYGLTPQAPIAIHSQPAPILQANSQSQGPISVPVQGAAPQQQLASTPQPQGSSVQRIGDYQPSGSAAEISQMGGETSQQGQNGPGAIPIYQPSGSPAGRLASPAGSGIGTLPAVQNPPAGNPQNFQQPSTAGNTAGGTVQQTGVSANAVSPLAPAGQGGTTQTAMKWRSQLSPLIDMAEREIAHLRPDADEDSALTRDYVENNVMLRMMYLMSDQSMQRARAWEPIPGIGPEQQEFWQYTMYGVSNYFDRNPQLVAPERYSEVVKSLGRATTKLSNKANLEIGDIALCSGVTNFGNYERFESYEFTPGQPVVLYAEIRNFTTRLTESNSYQTILAPTIEFLIPGNGPLSGRTVHEAIEMQPTEDLCKYPRHDFFIASLFSIPRELPQGRYVLKLTVTDKLGQKFSESTLNFVVK